MPSVRFGVRVGGWILWLAAALSGSVSVRASGGASIVPQSAESIELRTGASARVGSSDLTIVFEKVESDSRCPKGATCVWEGDAVVRLSVGRQGDRERTALTLHTHPTGAREARHAGLVVKLVELQPYPTTERPIDPKEYRVRLSVTRSEK